MGREHGEREGSSDRLFERPGIAQRPHQSMMRLNVRGIGLNGGMEGLRSLGRFADSEQLNSTRREGVSGGRVEVSHGCL